MALNLPYVVDGYELLEVVGESTFGTVFRARHRRSAQVVAFKWSHPRSVASEDSAEAQEYRSGRIGNEHLVRVSYQREADIANRLYGHPHINPLLGHGDAEGWPYLVSELQPNNLEAMIKRNGTLTVQQSVRIAMQVADGLAFAHDHNVIHRDIKPSNVLLAENGAVRLIDFGISRALDMLPEGSQGTPFGAWGTPAYRAPEQGLRADPDPRMDVHALGVTLFEMLTGRLPFGRGESEVHNNRLRAQALGHMPGPKDLVGAVPTWLDALVRIAIAVFPEDRWQSIAEMEADMRREGRPSPSPHPISPRVALLPMSSGYGLILVALLAGLPAWIETIMAVIAFVLILVSLVQTVVDIRGKSRADAILRLLSSLTVLVLVAISPLVTAFAISALLLTVPVAALFALIPIGLYVRNAKRAGRRA